MKSPIKYYLFVVILLIIDQAIKLWMHYVVIPDFGGEIELVPDVFSLHYVTNPGMAFGMELGGIYGKLLLTAFRLTASIGISWYIFNLHKKNAHTGFIWCISAILAGAFGNLIDSIFYGVFIPGNVIENAPTPWLHGQVIDMFYAKFLDGYWPEWVPYFGGTYNLTPIFNFADACIFCGVVMILIFQSKFIDEKVQVFENDSPEHYYIEENKDVINEENSSEINNSEDENIDTENKTN